MQKWWFSIVMLNYQRVIVMKNHLLDPKILDDSVFYVFSMCFPFHNGHFPSNIQPLTYRFRLKWPHGTWRLRFFLTCTTIGCHATGRVGIGHWRCRNLIQSFDWGDDIWWMDVDGLAKSPWFEVGLTKSSQVKKGFRNHPQYLVIVKKAEKHSFLCIDCIDMTWTWSLELFAGKDRLMF